MTSVVVVLLLQQLAAAAAAYTCSNAELNDEIQEKVTTQANYIPPPQSLVLAWE